MTHDWRITFFFLSTLILPLTVHADQVIMNDGKIYDGHIMGETNHSLLLSNDPLNPTPHFIPLRDIRTIVREHHDPEKPSDESYRFATTELLVSGRFFSSDLLDLHDAAGLHASGGFRLWRFLELNADVDWVPDTGGTLAITDGTTLRGYSDFYTYSGGFSGRFFPFFQKTTWRVQPYVLTGYQWARVIPKDSGDELKGRSILGGGGVSWSMSYHWSLEGRLVYRHTTYDHVEFLLRDGDLTEPLHTPDFTLSTGLAYHW